MLPCLCKIELEPGSEDGSRAKVMFCLSIVDTVLDVVVMAVGGVRVLEVEVQVDGTVDVVVGMDVVGSITSSSQLSRWTKVGASVSAIAVTFAMITVTFVVDALPGCSQTAHGFNVEVGGITVAKVVSS